MKQLRIGKERLAVASVKQMTEVCLGCDKPMQLVTTKKHGVFEYCKQCNLTRQVPE